LALFEDLEPDELLDVDDEDDEPVLDDFDSFDDEDDEEFSGLRKGWNFVEIFFSKGRLGLNLAMGSSGLASNFFISFSNILLAAEDS